VASKLPYLRSSPAEHVAGVSTEVLMQKFRFAVTVGAALVAISATAEAQLAGRVAAIPSSQQIPAGMCQIWIQGVPANRQPAPTDCNTARRNAPANSRVIYGSNQTQSGVYGNRTPGGVYGSTDPRLDPRSPQYDPRLDPRNSQYDPRMDPRSSQYDPRFDPRSGRYDPRYDRRSSRYDPRYDPRNSRDNTDWKAVKEREKAERKAEKEREKQWKKEHGNGKHGGDQDHDRDRDHD
jgi:hypothetical protein